MCVELGERPREVGVDVQVVRPRPAVRVRSLPPADQRGAAGVRGKYVLREVGGEGLRDERRVRGPLYRGQG